MANPSSTHRPTAHVVAHRAATSTFPVDRAWFRVAAARRTTSAWLAQPVRATRRAHALVAAGYAFVAVDAGLLVTLIGHR